MSKLRMSSKVLTLTIVGACAGLANAQYLQNDQLMPSPHYHGGNPVFLVPAIQLVSLDFDVSNGRISPPAAGGFGISSFFDVFTDITLVSNGGAPTHFSSHMNGQMKITNAGGGAYQTEMLQMDITGGLLPAGMMIRESPTLQSLGQTTITPQGSQFTINSFFDVFTELSLDNGQNWSPASGSEHMVGGPTPEPATFLAIGAGLFGLGLRRRKK